MSPETSFVKIRHFARAGCHAIVLFRAKGADVDGASPHNSVLTTPSGSYFSEPDVEVLSKNEFGIDGFLHFDCDSCSKVNGEHFLDFAGIGAYEPAFALPIERKMGSFQRKVASFLRGYLHQEWQHSTGCARLEEMLEEEDVDDTALLPDIPQQETSNDCGFFLLEQIFLLLQLSPGRLRQLARMPVEDISELPWPSQDTVARRKEMLGECLATLFTAAQCTGTTDVEVLLWQDEGLRAAVRSTLMDDVGFAETVERLAGFPDDTISAANSEPSAVANAGKRRRTNEGTEGSVS